MTDSPGMVGHIGLKLRLVFARDNRGYSGFLPPEGRAREGLQAGPYGRLHGIPDGGTQPGLEWRLIDLLPAEAPPAEGPALEPVDRAAALIDSRVSMPVELTLDRDEAEGYYLNLTSPQPSLFVLLRRQDVGSATAVHQWGAVPDAEAVTASYTEAARWMDGGMVVVRTPLPQPLLPWIAEFAQHHYPVDGKRKRGSFRPSFLSREEFGAVARSSRQEQAGAAVAEARSGSGDGR